MSFSCSVSVKIAFDVFIALILAPNCLAHMVKILYKNLSTQMSNYVLPLSVLFQFKQLDHCPSF